MGGLFLDVALRALCADLDPIAVKKTSRPDCHFLKELRDLTWPIRITDAPQ